MWAGSCDFVVVGNVVPVVLVYVFVNVLRIYSSVNGWWAL